jgi:hypothetical protein
LWAAMGGRVAGRKNKELGRGICGRTPEQRVAAGRRGGFISSRICKKKGIGIFGLTPEQRFEACHSSGVAAVVSGRLAEMRKRLTPDSHSRSGRRRACLRWHVGRGIISPNCSVCTNRSQEGQ